MELDAVRSLLREKMNVHPELTAPLTLKGLRRILARENVAWFVRPLPRPAKLIPYLGHWAIVVDAKQPERQHCYLGAHELGHLWLHHDRHFDRTETRVYNMSDSWEADPEEDDAEIFATMVLQGPSLWRWEPVAQLQLPDPAEPPAPIVKPVPRSLQLDLTDIERAPRPWSGRACLEQESAGVWFYVEAPSGRCWRIYDVAVAGSRREVLELGDARAIARIFVPASGSRRMYRFKPRERHELSSAYVERQWHEATTLAAFAGR
jgi:hypothetical protein